MLRWLAILGQSAMILLIAFGFGYSRSACGCASPSSWPASGSNILLTLCRRTPYRMKAWEAAAATQFRRPAAVSAARHHRRPQQSPSA
ncbi:MAG: hypothetical protein WDN06_06045 [Asticcacaulis sp.]